MPENDAPHQQCSICLQLLDQDYAFQKYGHEADNSYLPGAAAHLTLVKDLKPYSGRKLHLQQCPECGTYYLYRTDYEYLVDGSEDEEELTRLTNEQATEYLNSPTPGD